MDFIRDTAAPLKIKRVPAEGFKWRWGPVRTNLLTTNELFTRESESFGGCSRGPVVNVYVQDRDPVSPCRKRERAQGGGSAGTLWNQRKTKTPGQMPGRAFVLTV